MLQVSLSLKNQTKCNKDQYNVVFYIKKDYNVRDTDILGMRMLESIAVMILLLKSAGYTPAAVALHLVGLLACVLTRAEILLAKRISNHL